MKKHDFDMKWSPEFPEFRANRAGKTRSVQAMLADYWKDDNGDPLIFDMQPIMIVGHVVNEED